MAAQKKAFARSVARDALLKDLRALVARHAGPAAAAAAELQAHVERYIRDARENKSRRASELVRLLPVARDLAIDPKRWRAPSDLVLDPAAPPAAFDPLGLGRGPVPKWIKRGYEAVGRMDRQLACTIEMLSQRMAHAAAGRSAEGQRPRFDLRRVCPAEAHLRWEHKDAEKRRNAAEELADNLDPQTVVDYTASPDWAIDAILGRTLRKDPGRPLEPDECWGIVILTLLSLCPQFDPEEVGITLAMPWTSPDPDQPTRAGIMPACKVDLDHDVPEGAEERLWALARRARDLLSAGPAPHNPLWDSDDRPRPPEVQALIEAIGRVQYKTMFFQHLYEEAIAIHRKRGRPRDEDWPSEAEARRARRAAIVAAERRALMENGEDILAAGITLHDSEWAENLEMMSPAYQESCCAIAEAHTAVDNATAVLNARTDVVRPRFSAGLKQRLRQLGGMLRSHEAGEDGMGLIRGGCSPLDPRITKYLNEIDLARTNLFDVLVVKPIPKLDGWTKEELCKQGNIRSTTFNQIATAARITRPRSGQHGYRFGPDELQKLIDVASRANGKRKWHSAAERWREYLLATSGDT